MPNLLAGRNTIRMGVESVIQVLAVPVKAKVTLQAGSLVVSDSGFAAPAYAGAGLKALGRCERKVDNQLGSNGLVEAEVLRGTFRWDNDPADPISQSDLFATCFMSDDHTVSKTDGGGAKSAAGKIIQVDPEGIWVETI
jgi:hypothetical protein